jgi:predicted dehydrogenase
MSKNNDFAVLLLEFDDQITVKISAHGGCVHPHFHSLKIFGTNSSFVHDFSGTVWINSCNSNIKLEKEKAEYPAKPKRDAALKSFLDSLINPKKKPIIPHKDVFDVMSICLAAELSVKKGKLVDIQYI